jgi:hypothetical protein
MTPLAFRFKHARCCSIFCTSKTAVAASGVHGVCRRIQGVTTHDDTAAGHLTGTDNKYPRRSLPTCRAMSSMHCMYSTVSTDMSAPAAKNFCSRGLKGASPSRGQQAHPATQTSIAQTKCGVHSSSQCPSRRKQHPAHSGLASLPAPRLTCTLPHCVVHG